MGGVGRVGTYRREKVSGRVGLEAGVSGDFEMGEERRREERSSM